jgi:hypothetical protein
MTIYSLLFILPATGGVLLWFIENPSPTTECLEGICWITTGVFALGAILWGTHTDLRIIGLWYGLIIIRTGWIHAIDSWRIAKVRAKLQNKQ